MLKPRYVEIDGQLYERVVGIMRPETVHYLPFYRKQGFANLHTKCGRNIHDEGGAGSGTVEKSKVTCNTCRRLLGLAPHVYPKAKLL